MTLCLSVRRITYDIKVLHIDDSQENLAYKTSPIVFQNHIPWREIFFFFRPLMLELWKRTAARKAAGTNLLKENVKP